MKEKLVRVLLIIYFVPCAFIFLTSHANQTNMDLWNVLRSEFYLNHDTSRAEVQEQIRWLVAHPSYIVKVCQQSEPYIYHILTEIKKRKLPGELALLPMIESAYDPFAYSGAGAAGLWQLMPNTGSDLGLKQDWWFDGRRSIRPSTDAALNYLLYLNRFFGGNWVYAIAAYDAGEGTISRAIKENQRYGHTPSFWDLPVPRETQIYVPRLLALAEVFANPARYHLVLPEIPYLPYFQEVNIGSQIDLNHAAKMAGISYKELIKLNPGYNRWTTAPYKPFKLLIPTEKVHQFNLNLAHLPENKRVSWTKHYVQAGDSLDSIAIKYHTTVNLIKQLNQLKNNKIHLKQPVLIPNTKNAPIVLKKEIAIAKTTVYDGQLQLMTNKRIIHIVQANDSYKRLEQLYGISSKNIILWNKLKWNQPLHQGQQLVLWKKIKQPMLYIVKKGDSLNLLARKYHTKIERIIELNSSTIEDRTIHAGQKILIG